MSTHKSSFIKILEQKNIVQVALNTPFQKSSVDLSFNP